MILWGDIDFVSYYYMVLWNIILSLTKLFYHLKILKVILVLEKTYISAPNIELVKCYKNGISKSSFGECAINTCHLGTFKLILSFLLTLYYFKFQMIILLEKYYFIFKSEYRMKC